VDIGEKIKQLREEKDWAQQELADKTGISRPTISQIENGMVHSPSADNLIKIANALEVDVNELFVAAGYQVSASAEKQKLINEAMQIERKLHEFINKLRQYQR
jgi:transcriptional regulator with XRE-family HTH domain